MQQQEDDEQITDIIDAGVNDMSLVCPVDLRNDSIQSIPALVASGTASGTFSGPNGGIAHVNGGYGYVAGYTTLHGTLTSDLASSLAKPVPPKVIGFGSLYGWSILFYLSICIIVGPFLVWPRFKRSIAKFADDQKKLFTPGVSFVCILMLLFGWIPHFCLLFFPLRKMLYRKLDYPLRHQRWEKACSVWERLYYCHRCNIVIDPLTNRHFPPSQLYSYLRIHEYEL